MPDRQSEQILPSETQADLEALAKACEARRETGLMFHPRSVELVAEALRALGRERAKRGKR